jgi:hypothetical protein
MNLSGRSSGPPARNQAEPDSGFSRRRQGTENSKEERVFVEGNWHEGLYPYDGASPTDLNELAAFRSEIDHWVARRDARGRRLFAIPADTASDDPAVLRLDRQSMSAFLLERGWTSPRLHWLVDYACRDDYGLHVGQTSAWAGLFYFAARLTQPGAESQPVITWPQGNGRIVAHLNQSVGERLRLGHAVVTVTTGDASEPAQVTAWDTQNERLLRYRAERVIFPAPQFLRPHLIRGDATTIDFGAFRYGSWLVANLHLDRRPAESGFPMAWDNVIYNSKSLGYVNAAHQIGLDHGPTVLTWYYALTDTDPRVSRRRLLELGWADWADLALADLSVPHPEIRTLVTRLDVMRWGHAMIQPRVGFRTSADRKSASLPRGRVHFAGTDLSGIALMEEAFYHGVRAAEEVMRAAQVT